MKKLLVSFFFLLSLIVPSLAFAAVGYDGTGDSHTVNNPNVPVTTEYSICFWINTPSFIDNQSIVSLGDASGNGVAILTRATGYIRVRHYVAGVAQNNDGPAGMTVDAWHHVCVVHASDDKVYIDATDGIPDATDDIDNPGAAAATDDFVIGQTIVNGAFGGYIGNLADVVYYDTALSNAEVALLADKSTCPEDVQGTHLKIFTRLTVAGSVTDQSTNAFPVVEAGNPTTQSGPTSLPSCDGGGGTPPPGGGGTGGGGGGAAFSGPWPLGIGDINTKIPVKTVDESDRTVELTTVSSLTCYRVKNGTGGLCAGTTAEISDVNMPGSWLYTLGASDVDTSGSVLLRFSQTGMAPFETTLCVGCKTAIQEGGFNGLSATFDGAITSEAATLIGLAASEIDADGHHIGDSLVVFDANGKFEAKSCIVNSDDSDDTVTTADDISARIAVSDNYVISADAGCKIGSLSTTAKAEVNAEADQALTDYGALKPTIAARTLDVTAAGEAGIDLNNAAGDYNLAQFATDFFSGFFSVNSGTNYGASQANSVVKQIADNAAGSCSGTINCNITQVGGSNIATPQMAGYLRTTSIETKIGTAQSVTPSTIRLASSEVYKDDDLKLKTSITIVSATTGVGQNRCVCGNAESNDLVTLCSPWKTTPTGTIVYAVIPTPNCN